MNAPWLIQRCELQDGKLMYDYMGAAEFEFGACPESLKRIFTSGPQSFSTSIQVGADKVAIYIVAAEGFMPDKYTPYLDQIMERKLRLKECTMFDDAVQEHLGVLVRKEYDRTNVWFDIENDVLWTLTEDNQKALVKVLEDIKRFWAEKSVTKPEAKR